MGCAWRWGRSCQDRPDLGWLVVLAGSSRSVTSLAKPERKGVYGCGREAAVGFAFLRCVCTGSQLRGRAAHGHFPFPNPPLAAAAPGLGHPPHAALLQGRFTRRFKDQSSSCAQNRGYFLFFVFSFKHLAGAKVSWAFRLRFSLGNERSLFFPAWLHLCPPTLVMPRVLVCGGFGP